MERTRLMTVSPRYTAREQARHDPEDRHEHVDPRDPFEVDRARIVHASAFRRLQGKTQIFGVGEGDFFRTRLTHSMEVAQIGKGLALFLNRLPALADAPLSTELVEAACLAHDLGHPPFGHNGEAALQELMHAHGGFEGNAQNLRILTRLEIKRDGFGLNLTRATLEAVLKYLQPYGARKAARGNGPGAAAAVEKCFYDDDAATVAWVRNGTSHEHRSLEAEVMEWADDIAYSVHDLEDGLHADLIRPESFEHTGTLERIAQYACKKGAAGVTADDVQRLMRALLSQLRAPSANGVKAARKALTSRLIHRFVTHTGVRQRPGVAGYELALDIPEEVWRETRILMGVEFVLLIRNPRVTTLEYKGRLVVQRLFDAYAQPDAGDLLPEDVRELWEPVREDEAARLRVVCDYIAAMTDGHALRLYRRLFEPGAGQASLEL
ncbi:MAG: dNTP triphosphohydrolase [Candidatus Sericytochromatia bacterium]|nr:dNTP triphosphohydrolase [Candidatus Sericytochromatia bacterium]